MGGEIALLLEQETHRTAAEILRRLRKFLLTVVGHVFEYLGDGWREY